MMVSFKGGQNQELFEGLVCPKTHASLEYMPMAGGRSALICEKSWDQYDIVGEEVPIFETIEYQGLEAPPAKFWRRLISPFIWVLLAFRVSVKIIPGKLGNDPALDKMFEYAVGRFSNLNNLSLLSVYNIYLKAIEGSIFSERIPERPSLEFGGGWGFYTNEIYGGNCRIDDSADVLIELHVPGKLHKDRHLVFDRQYCALPHKLPKADKSLRTVFSIHILDHIKNLDPVFAEMNRVLVPGGTFWASTYAQNTYEFLPEFPILKKLGMLSERYRNWRLRKVNARAGWPYLIDDGFGNGLNQFSLVKWKELAEHHGLELVEAKPFNWGRVWMLLTDAEMQGFFCPKFMTSFILKLVHRLCRFELLNPPPFDQAANVFLVFRKKSTT